MNVKLTTLLLTALLFAACSGEKPVAGGQGSEDPENHDDRGDNHEGGNEGDWEGELHGDAHELGEAKVASFKFKVTQLGEITAGGEAAFDIEVLGTSKPDAVYAWVGIDSGVGSRQTRIDVTEGKMHCHAEVPEVLADNAMLWLQVDQDAGPEKTSLSLHR